MRRLIVLSLLTTVLVLEVVAVHRFVASAENLVFDFGHLWLGSRAMLFEARNPYGEEVTDRIQMALVGRLVNWDSCQQGFPGFIYPAVIAFTVPHFLMPYSVALPLWIVTQQVLLVLTCWLVVLNARRAVGMAASRLLALTLAGTTYRYSLLNLGFGQFSAYVLFWLVLAWWLWQRERYVLAGMALSLVLIKPQLAFLIIPLWLLLATAMRRWRFAIALGVSSALLVSMPCLLIGNWFPDFLDMVNRASGSCQSSIYQRTSLAMGVGALILLGATFVATWFRSPRDQLSKNIGGLLSFGVVATHMVAPYVHDYDLVLTLIPLLFGLSILHDTPGLAAAWLRFMYWTTLVALPWILWFLAPNHSPDAIERWIIPLVTAALLAGLPLVQRQQRRKDPSALT